MRTTLLFLFNVLLSILSTINCDINYVPNTLFDPNDSSKGPQLIGKTVIVSAQNGYRSTIGNYVGTVTNSARNDLMCGEIVSLYLNQYLTNAGINVVSVRERWFDQDQITVDINNINFVSSGSWTPAGSSIYTQVSLTETATATFLVKVNADGYQPVYVRYPSGSDRSTETTFKVSHTGGVSIVKLNQQVFNNVWQYLGIFHFTTGCSCSVTVSNQGSDTSKVVVVDAIRVGSGKLSGRPAWKSGAQDFMNSIGLTATDETICRNEMGEYVFNNTASASASDFIHLGLRINSGGAASTGAETYSYLNTDAFHSTTLASLETSYIAPIQSNFHATINAVYTLTNRGVKTTNTPELREGNIIPTFLAYPGFISNPTETLFMRRASGRDAIARGLYKGIARAFSSTVTILPVAVSHLMAQNLGNKQVKVCWKSNTDSLETLAYPDGFKIYTSKNGYGFDNGFLIFDNSTTCHTFSALIVGQLYYFKVAAFNKGGESLTKNMVGVRVIPETQIGASILVVDSFDRDFIFGEDEAIYRYQYNHIIQYGESIASSGYYFDSILNEYLSLQPSFLNSYSTVIWSCGAETSSDDSFSSTEQTIINNYLSNGNKNLFVSGSEIATDLNAGTQADKDFLNSTLKASFVSGKTTGYWFQSSSSVILTGVDNITFSSAKENMYRLSTCDVISPTEGNTELVYGGTSSGIALSYNGTYRLVFLSFPFELIDSSSDRNFIMSNILNFFNISTIPSVVTSVPTPTPVPTTIYSTPTPTSSSVIPTETATPTPTPTATKDLTTFNKILIGSVVGGGGLLLILSLAMFFVLWKRKKDRRSEMMYSSSVKLDKLSKDMIGNNSSIDATLMNTQTEVSLPGFLQLDYLLQLREETQLSGGGGGVLMEGIILDPELVKRHGFYKVAIKKTHAIEDEKNDNFHREISVMWSLAFDPHIAKLVGFCEQPSRCIVTKLYKCDLNHFLHVQPYEPLSFDLSLSFLKDICSGLTSIHSLEIAHRDIKSANILLDQKPDGSLVCVICDFGLAAVSEDNEVRTEKSKKTNLKGFSPRYAAPEVFIRTRLDHLPVNANQEMKSDIYSFGILMWEILTRKTPWEGLNREDIEREVRSGSRPEIPKVNKEVNILFEIASTCWKEEPQDRPKASEVLKKLKNY